MKKIIISATIIIVLISTVIIGYNIKIYSGTLVCTNTYEEDSVSFKTTYKVEYKKKYATKLVSIETINTYDVTLLNDYKTNLEMMYLRFNEIPHYQNTISIKENTLTVFETIEIVLLVSKNLSFLFSSYIAFSFMNRPPCRSSSVVML